MTNPLGVGLPKGVRRRSLSKKPQTTTTTTRKNMILQTTLEWSGILKLAIDPTKNKLDLDAKGLTINKSLHITLVHQQCFKLIQYKNKKFSKYLQKNPIKKNGMPFNVDINLNSAEIFEEGERETLVFFVTPESQKRLDSLVQTFFKEYGIQKEFNLIRNQTPDAKRKFHLSYANKSGNPGDSVAIVWKQEEQEV